MQRSPWACGCAPGVRGLFPEVGFVGGQAVGFQLHGLAFGVLAHQQKIPVVGHQDLTVFSPVAGDLLAVGGDPGVVCWWA